MDLSDLEALMGGPVEASGGTGGVWVVSPNGVLDEGLLRLLGKARVVADALGGYVYLLKGCGDDGGDPTIAIRAGADKVLRAEGVPTLPDLTAFFQERAPQAVLFARDQSGRTLGPGLAQALRGGLCANAADLGVDPVYQRIFAHQPILNDAARQAVAMIGSPAIAVVDTNGLPAAFSEPWRTGDVEDTGLTWPEQPTYPPVELPRTPLTLKNAPVVVAAGLGLKDETGFRLAEKLAGALGGVVAGDMSALDAGWITEEQLVGLTGATVAPKLYLALGIDGDTSQFMATAEAACIVAVQADATAPIVPVADYNIIADPAEFARALLEALEK
jgi:electron transfer flavoprotein alpha subunit